MSRSYADPYRALIQRFNQAGIRYVVVGMSGINYYAESPAGIFSTLDYDVLVEPTLENAQKALSVLRKMGFEIGARQGRFRPEAFNNLIRKRNTLVATTADGFMVELLLRISGYAFSEMAQDAATFTVRGVPVRVGRLSKLLGSKRAAGRPKDRVFLRRYRALLEEGEEGRP